MVNRGGITFAFRVDDETGAERRAGRPRLRRLPARSSTSPASSPQVEALDNQVPTAAQTQLYLEFRRLLDRAVRWFIQHRPAQVDIAAEVERFRDVVARLEPQLPELLLGAERGGWSGAPRS